MIKYKKNINHPKARYFKVNGAGKIEVSESCEFLCGGERGFSFGAEWGKHGYAGGVLHKKEARKLIKFLSKSLRRQKKSARLLNFLVELFGNMRK